jgi:zinc protease
LAILASAGNMEVEAYVDAAASASLIEEELPGAEIVAEKQLEELDAVEWTLANNVKVIYRHADYEKDNVLLSAFSKGGTSLWDDEYVPSMQMATTFIEAYGIGEYDAITLQKMLAGKKVSLSPTLSGLTEGFSGSTTPKDFETMMQLTYLYFEKPRFDKEAHDALMNRYMAYVKNLEKDPRKIMQDSLTIIRADYHPRARTIGTQFLSEVDFNNIEKIYNDRFSDAGDFTFFIVGNIDEETAREMAKKYLGSLTDSDREETWIDRKVRRPEGLTEKVIPVPLTTPKANVNILYETDMEFNPENMLALKVLEGILDLRYTEKVREEEGGTYGVGIGTSLNKFPVEKATVQINFDCDPKRADELKTIVYGEIDKIVDEGPTQVDFDKTIKNLLKDREQSREHNSFWLNALNNLYYTGLNTASEENYEDILNSMTQEDVQQLTKSLFNDPDLMDIVFIPKSE